LPLNEAETRAEHIDPALAKAGWGVVPDSRIRREFPITAGRILGQGKRDKALAADYLLEYKGARLAVIEAKAWDKYYTEGVGQAKDYATRLGLRFAYATNGQKIYAMDMENGLEGDIAAFPTPDELWQARFSLANSWRDTFAAEPFKEKGGWSLRYYQAAAITKAMEAVADGKNRSLLTLATGTGKTSIAFQIAWKLFQARWTLQKNWQRRPRILFLADRNILADQAYNDFDSFMAFPQGALVRIRPTEIKKKGYVPKNGSIFFTIFQTFMSGTDAAGNFVPYFG
jgi:type I restriction enzyme R subunit